jgi:hypothetical protein
VSGVVFSNARRTDSGALRTGTVTEDGNVYVATVYFVTADRGTFHGDTLRTTSRDDAIAYAKGVVS